MRPKIFITIDWVLRTPAFLECFHLMKKEIAKDFIGTEFDVPKRFNKQDDIRFFWAKMRKNPKYEKHYITTNPVMDENFDITFKSYFLEESHRKRFLDDYAFNLYSSSQSIDKDIIAVINAVYEQIGDVYLIDTINTERKPFLTFSWLSKARFKFKGLLLAHTKKEYDDLVKEYKPIGVYDPFNGSKPLLGSPEENASILLEFFDSLESKIKNETIPTGDN